MSPTDVYVLCAFVTVVADVVAIVAVVRGARAIRRGTAAMRQGQRELMDVARRVMELTDATITTRTAPPAPLVLPGHPNANWPPSAPDPDDPWGQRE